MAAEPNMGYHIHFKLEHFTHLLDRMLAFNRPLEFQSGAKNKEISFPFRTIN